MGKTIGILGGMGPLATADLFRKITLLTDAACDDEIAGSYDGRNDWGNLTINFVAMKPKRTPV